jgi:uncharacterized damage-inducible protein DinB
MPTSNPLDILLLHDDWATRQILHACEKLTPDQFSRKFDIGPGSLQATLTHMIAAINAWIDTLAVQPSRPRLDSGGVQYTPAQLLDLHIQAEEELSAIAKKHPLDEIVKRVRDGKEYTFTRGAVLTHITTHGMHHRAQCLNMLKHLGVSPLPPSSVTEWSRLADSAARSVAQT